MNYKKHQSVAIDKTAALLLHKHYEKFGLKKVDNPYVLFCYEDDLFRLTIYSNKTGSTLSLEYDNDDVPLIKFSRFFPREMIIGSGWMNEETQIGSDEVGVGDVFGGEVIVAVYLSAYDIALLKDYNIDDSKKINDENIRRIAPLLKKKIKYYSITISAKKYNQMIDKGYNSNSIKAYLHNFAHLELIKKYQLPKNSPVYIDQFCSPENYYAYLKKEETPSNLNFFTKGESKFPSIAAASMIARYNFLINWEKTEKELQMIIPKGASYLTDNVLDKLVERNGYKFMEDYVKKNFKNYKILEKKYYEKND